MIMRERWASGSKRPPVKEQPRMMAESEVGMGSAWMARGANLRRRSPAAVLTHLDVLKRRPY